MYLYIAINTSEMSFRLIHNIKVTVSIYTLYGIWDHYISQQVAIYYNNAFQLQSNTDLSYYVLFILYEETGMHATEIFQLGS